MHSKDKRCIIIIILCRPADQREHEWRAYLFWMAPWWEQSPDQSTPPSAQPLFCSETGRQTGPAPPDSHSTALQHSQLIKDVAQQAWYNAPYNHWLPCDNMTILTCDSHVVAVEDVRQAIGYHGVLQGGVAHLHSCSHMHCMRSLSIQRRNKQLFSHAEDFLQQLIGKSAVRTATFCDWIIVLVIFKKKWWAFACCRLSNYRILRPKQLPEGPVYDTEAY